MSSKKLDIPKRLSHYLANGPVSDWGADVFQYTTGTLIMGHVLACYFLGMNPLWFIVLVPALVMLGFVWSMFVVHSLPIPYSVRLREIQEQVASPNRPRLPIPHGEREYTVEQLREMLNGQAPPTMETIQEAADIMTEYIQTVGPMCLVPETSEEAVKKIIQAVDLFENRTGLSFPEWIRLTSDNYEVYEFDTGEKLRVPTTSTMLHREEHHIDVFKLEPGWEDGKVLSAKVLSERSAKYNNSQFITLACTHIDKEGNESPVDLSLCFVL